MAKYKMRRWTLACTAAAKRSVLVAILGSCLFSAAVASEAEPVGADSITLQPFSSDGCSLFPDHSLINEDDWCECCFLHDIAYWKGGTKSERKKADKALRECVQKRTDSDVLADFMYEGVRIGGSPYFYNWYRWGYGWPYPRAYQPLTDTEKRYAQILLDEYFSTVDVEICPSVSPSSSNSSSIRN